MTGLQDGAQSARELGAVVVGGRAIGQQADLGPHVVDGAGDEQGAHVDVVGTRATGVARCVSSGGAEHGPVGQGLCGEQGPVAVCAHRTDGANDVALAITNGDKGADFGGTVDDLTV